MKVAIYARVSTDDKDQNPERQILKCKQYCELHNHNVCGIFKEHITGDSDPRKREEFSKLLNEDPSAIIVYSIDRLSRQHPSKVMRLLSELKDQGIKTISITEPAFNMEGEMSDLIQYILSWFNNYFLMQLKRNIRSGLDRARAQGKVIGRPGVKYNKYRAFHLLFNEKRSQRYVAKELGSSLATINRFKRVVESDRDLFIKYSGMNQTDDLEHK